MKLPFVSVIIPTYHDWHRLRVCLDALKHQTYDRNRYEVIVVNNAVDEPPADLRLPDSWMLEVEPKPGSYAARNRGIRVSHGEILAFTDSDCIPDPEWIEEAARILRQGANRVAGRVELFYKGIRLTPAELYEKAFAFRQEKNAAAGSAVTANMLAWRYCFTRTGVFNEALMSGGDYEWGIRAHELGLNIAYVSEAVVYHPARATIRELVKKRRRVIDGKCRMGVLRLNRHTAGALIRSARPPLSRFRKVAKLSGFTWFEKLLLAAVLYYIRLYDTYAEWRVVRRLSNANRS